MTLPLERGEEESAASFCQAAGITQDCHKFAGVIYRDWGVPGNQARRPTRSSGLGDRPRNINRVVLIDYLLLTGEVAELEGRANGLPEPGEFEPAAFKRSFSHAGQRVDEFTSRHHRKNGPGLFAAAVGCVSHNGECKANNGDKSNALTVPRGRAGDSLRDEFYVKDN
ncbi:hypothetical protein BV22DRAFT_1044111 [Leucogyrophana mollusca]|uniref:Uncharacterized protein n=1 Tax=Leucogyrophana mollusca TaxID=85980 RepID=A0ACB8BUR5_9AGAM|nr:hypothetical protein BV22DRAFT_1044111 [Leucogyrophana mollusca]